MSIDPRAPAVLPAMISAQSLARAVIRGDVSAEQLRRLPPQSLFMALKQCGLTSAAQAIKYASLEQCRLLIDFDCWSKDRFSENNFWDWLSLADEETGLAILQKLLNFVDLKLVGLILGRYVEVLTFEEPTDNPPGPRFHTPDKGRTWVGIKLEDSTRHFLLSRFLAVIFETDADLFYQLLATSAVATEAMLEEEAFQERTKRLSAEGIPDAESAARINAPLASLPSARQPPAAIDAAPLKSINSIEPLICEKGALEPLHSALAAISDQAALNGELTFIMNAAIVHFGVDFSQQEQVLLLAGKVRGALNIGLEIALTARGGENRRVCEELGLQNIYRLGLNSIMALRREALQTKKKLAEALVHDSAAFALISALLQNFPEVPSFFKSSCSKMPRDLRLAAAEKLDVAPSPIETMEEAKQISRANEIISSVTPATPG